MHVRRLAALGVGTLVLVASSLSFASPAATAKLTVAVSGRGSVTSSPKGIVCPRVCSKAFRKGANVTLAAKPAAGAAFARWTGACKGTRPTCTIRLGPARRVGALFKASAPEGFTPQTLAGTWSGSWRNETFGSTGPASLVFTPVDVATFTFAASLGGNVFGCPPPPPTTGAVTRGTGPNTWSSTGFNVQTTAGSGGKVAFEYTHVGGGALTGSGTSGCNPAITWQLTEGAFSGSTFTGRVAISLGGNPLATSVVALTRA